MPGGRPRHDDVLTPREWEVVRLLEEGLTNEEIARRLGISFAGARYHVAEIISKLGVAGRAEAAAWSRENRPAAPRRGLWPVFPGLTLKSPALLAGAGVAAAALIAAAVILFLPGGGGTDDEDLPELIAIDGRTAEEFLRSIEPPAPLQAGQVLYTRVEVYERHGPKSPQITTANGIPVERYVRETWVEAGPNDTIARAYGLTTDESSEPVLVHVAQDGVSRIILLPSGSLFRQDEMPQGMTVTGDRAGRIETLLHGLSTGELVAVGQTESEVVLEELHDQAYYERHLIDGRGFTEEQKAARRAKFFQRDMSEEGFAVPYYGDLNAIALAVRLNIDTQGLTTRQETSIQTEDGESIVVSSAVFTDYEVVDEIPPEVIALTR